MLIARKSLVVLTCLSLICAADSLRAAEPNTLSDAEKAAGWKLLFDGKSTDGWRNYKKQDVNPAWKVENSELICADPSKAGDLLTKDEYGAFELSLEYKMSPNSNSGVIFLGGEQSQTIWMTGPEV